MIKDFFDEVGFTKDELSGILGCFVCGIKDHIDDDGDHVAVITFFNPAESYYMKMEIGSHGYVFITDPNRNDQEANQNDTD